MKAKAPEAGPSGGGGGSRRVYLGTIPDYADTGTKGVLLSGVAEDGPAEKGGMQSGDVIVELAGQTIENIYDYTKILDALKIGEPVKAVVERDGKRIELTVTPGSRGRERYRVVAPRPTNRRPWARGSARPWPRFASEGAELELGAPRMSRPVILALCP
ncbi:MAG: PDZ domain-containing protein [Anaerolineae bacterium]